MHVQLFLIFPISQAYNQSISKSSQLHLSQNLKSRDHLLSKSAATTAWIQVIIFISCLDDCGSLPKVFQFPRWPYSQLHPFSTELSSFLPRGERAESLQGLGSFSDLPPRLPLALCPGSSQLSQFSLLSDHTLLLRIS